VWLGVTLWQALQLDTLCAEALPVGRERVPWSLVAAIVVIARLCEPSSELYVAERWYARTALEDLLGVPADLINDDRLYRLLDHLVWHKSDIEHHLRQRLGELFALEYDLLLDDVTSTYFEGVAARNEMAQRGHSRDQRADCLQVCIALVVTREGMPLGYEVFDGNATDVTTVQTMEARYGLAQRIWVMDRGMRSQRNVQWLRETGRRYLLGAPRSILATGRWSSMT
jgi:transposase